MVKTTHFLLAPSDVAKLEAARAMLSALERMNIVLSAVNWQRGPGDAIEELQAAIAQAKAAGINTD